MKDDVQIRLNRPDEPSAPAGPTQPVESRPAPPSGRRQAFQDVRRELTDDELRNPGVMKLILDELEKAEVDNEILNAYVDRYHQADKRASILEEKLKTATAIEVFFAVGLAVGAMIVGLAPFLWEDKAAYGVFCLIVGGVLIVGSIVARFIRS